MSGSTKDDEAEFRDGPVIFMQFEQRRLHRLGGGAALLLPDLHDVAPQMAPVFDLDEFRAAHGRTMTRQPFVRLSSMPMRISRSS